MRDLADIICDSPRDGVSEAQRRTLVEGETSMTGDQAADMLGIAVRYECED